MGVRRPVGRGASSCWSSVNYEFATAACLSVHKHSPVKKYKIGASPKLIATDLIQLHQENTPKRSWESFVEDWNCQVQRLVRTRTGVERLLYLRLERNAILNGWGRIKHGCVGASLQRCLSRSDTLAGIDSGRSGQNREGPWKRRGAARGGSTRLNERSYQSPILFWD